MANQAVQLIIGRKFQMSRSLSKKDNFTTPGFLQTFRPATVDRIMTFREFLQLTEMFYSKGKGPKPKHNPHSDAPGALAKNDLNLHLYAGGGGAGAMPGKKMQKKT